MKISIAICTWNRSRLLKQTIDSLSCMNIPGDVQWEILIVDNGSTDDTRDIIDSFRDALPVKYLFESVQGHSASRNCAIRNSTGQYIVWTDNDVIVGKRWLAEYAFGFRRHPQAAFFGGKILPVFESGKPRWLAETWEKCKAVYAARDLGNREMELAEGVYPYGANFAVRADVQKQFLFDPEHGRKGNGMLGEDEISVMQNISHAGHQGVWLPKVALKHFIPDDRATPEYVGRYFVGQGQTNILQGKTDSSAFQALRNSLSNQLAWRLKKRFAQPEEWVSHLIRASLSWGEYLAIRSRGRLTS